MRYRSVAGFTLLEVLSALAISMITLGVGVPMVGGFIDTNKVAGQVNALRGALALTRSEAIRRNQPVVICKSSDSQNCSTQSAWEKGWIIFVDSNRNRQREPDEDVIGVHGQLSNGHTLAYRGTGSFNYVTYFPNGATNTNGTFTLCAPSSPEWSKALILIRSGRVRLSTTKSDGSPLDCTNSINSAG